VNVGYNMTCTCIYKALHRQHILDKDPLTQTPSKGGWGDALMLSINLTNIVQRV